MIIRQGLAIATLGATVGLLGTFVLTGLTASDLYQSLELAPFRPDPGILVIGTLVLFAAALGACLGPARRAMAADPMETLRHD